MVLLDDPGMMGLARCWDVGGLQSSESMGFRDLGRNRSWNPNVRAAWLMGRVPWPVGRGPVGNKESC